MDLQKITTAQFNDTFPPIMDGVGNVAKNYAYWLHKKYGYCCAVVPQVPKFEDNEEFPVLRFMSLPIPGMGKDQRRLGIPKLDAAILKRLGKLDFDLLHTHCPFPSGELALKIAKEREIPIVTTFHSKYKDDFEETFNTQNMIDWAMKKIMKFYQSVDYVWAPNKGAKEELYSYGYEGEIEIMENGTDLISPTKEELSRYRRAGLERIGVPENSFVMLFIGQHRWIKNIRLILDAAKLLADRRQDFTIIFAGSGSDEPEMRKVIEAHKIEGQVKLLGRIIEREEIKKLYAAADLLLFPSLYDTASLVMREAAAFYTPSVLVEGASTAEGVDHGQNGFISADNPEAYAALLSQLLDTPGMIRTAGEGANQTIYQPWEKIVDRVYTRYLEIRKEFAEIKNKKVS